MAGRARTKEVALQVEVESQEDWEEVIGKEGLTVVDIYQEWCGPCKAMISTFKRIKNESGDDLLNFAMAKADAIESLERYRGKCEPCFLFYASGMLVAVVRGANCPLLTTTILDQLAQEHKVLEGTAERKEIHDPKFPHHEDKRQRSTAGAEDQSGSESDSDEEDEEEEEVGDGMVVGGENINYLGMPHSAISTKVAVEKQFTVAIINPDVVADEKVDEILEKLKTVGVEILESTQRQLTVDEAKNFFDFVSHEDNFEEMAEFMASGPSCILVLTKGEFGEGIIEEWLELVGPATVSDAQEQAPESLRAVYGHADNPHSKAFHASANTADAKRELRFFFPDFVVPKIPLGRPKVAQQPRTLAIVRPAVVAEHKDEISMVITGDGFNIQMEKEIQLTHDQAVEFYMEHEGQDYYEALIEQMTSAPSWILVLEKEDAVETWKKMLGPKELDVAQIEAPDSLRAKYAVPDCAVNQLHGSDSDAQAEKEISFFFPVQQTLATIKPDAYDIKEKLMLKIYEAGFQLVAQKDMQLTEELVPKLYKDCVGKEYYEELKNAMMRGPSCFLILSRRDAVAGLKKLIGATDPDTAKINAPESLRAQFGSDVLYNAIHGASDEASALYEIHLIFGDVEFDVEGNLKKKKKEKKKDGTESAEGPVKQGSNLNIEETAEEEGEHRGSDEQWADDGKHGLEPAPDDGTGQETAEHQQGSGENDEEKAVENNEEQGRENEGERGEAPDTERGQEQAGDEEHTKRGDGTGPDQEAGTEQLDQGERSKDDDGKEGSKQDDRHSVDLKDDHMANNDQEQHEGDTKEQKEAGEEHKPTEQHNEEDDEVNDVESKQDLPILPDHELDKGGDEEAKEDVSDSALAKPADEDKDEEAKEDVSDTSLAKPTDEEKDEEAKQDVSDTSLAKPTDEEKDEEAKQDVSDISLAKPSDEKKEEEEAK